MKTENLIINEIDHSVFDLEWAKRGGVVKTSVCEQPAFAKCLGVKQDGRALFMFFINEDENERWHYGFVYPQNFNTLSMATPSECAEAGVEYIEYHGWRPIGTAPLDTLVIVETDQKKVGCAIFEGRNESEHFGLGSFASRYRNWMPMPQPQKDE